MAKKTASLFIWFHHFKLSQIGQSFVVTNNSFIGYSYFLIYNGSDNSRLKSCLSQTPNPVYLPRFGGWSIGEPSPSSEVIGGTTENLIVWYNNKGVHAVPSYLNAIHNAMLRTTVAESEQDPTQFGITTYNHPLLLNAKEATTATM